MALPNSITNTTPLGSDAPSTIDNQIRDLKLAVQDILGIPNATAISAASLSIAATGLTAVVFRDAAGNPATAGHLQRNGTLLNFYDGAANRVLVSRDLAETLTNKTIALGSNTVSGTIAEFNTAVTDANLATLAGSETLTNKTIALGSNTVSGTTAQFNAALSDGDFATIAGAETLTNKTLTAPVIASIVNTGTLTLPTATDTLVGRATTDTLTNKTLTAPTIGGATVSGAAGATPTANVLYTDSVVKGWVKFSATGTIADDLNVSSITDNGVGDWTINWATAFANANYALAVITGSNSTAGIVGGVDGGNNPTTTAARVTARSDAGSLSDPTGSAEIYAMAIGDQ